MIHKTTSIAAAVAATLAIALAPQSALAHKKHKAVKHHRAVAAAPSMSSTERRMQEMEMQIQQLQSELRKTHSETKMVSDKVEEHQARVNQLATEVQKEEDEGHDLLFFRGGYAAMSQARNNELLLNNQFINPGAFDKKDGEGWYTGAGLDFRLTHDAWGMLDNVAVDGELMFQYMNFGTSHNALVGFASGAQIENKLTQFTLAASPKIKFKLMDGALRPWIIPFGLSINVISPPSSGVTVLNPGLQLGTGVEYKIWESLWAGIDFRYNFTGGDLNYKTTLPGGTVILNKTNIDGLTTGAYLGFGF